MRLDLKYVEEWSLRVDLDLIDGGRQQWCSPGTGESDGGAAVVWTGSKRGLCRFSLSRSSCGRAVRAGPPSFRDDLRKKQRRGGTSGHRAGGGSAGRGAERVRVSRFRDTRGRTLHPDRRPQQEPAGEKIQAAPIPGGRRGGAATGAPHSTAHAWARTSEKSTRAAAAAEVLFFFLDSKRT